MWTVKEKEDTENEVDRSHVVQETSLSMTPLLEKNRIDGVLEPHKEEAR